MANDEVWRCDLKSPCVKYCESKNNKHQCGIYKRDNMTNLNNTFCKATEENINKILKRNCKFFEIGCLSNYLGKYQFIILKDIGNRIEARFENEIPKSYRETTWEDDAIGLLDTINMI